MWVVRLAEQEGVLYCVWEDVQACMCTLYTYFRDMKTDS